MFKYLSGAEHHHLISNHIVIVAFKPKPRFASTSPATLTILLLILFIYLLASTAKAESKSQSTPIRIGITPFILDQHAELLHDWKSYLKTYLKQPVEYIPRYSYGKITTHLLKGELDFGWICGYPHVQHQALLEFIALPLYNCKPHYQSYLIVPNIDINTHSLLDLKDPMCAYSGPDSNSGYLYTQYSFEKANKEPETFFKQVFFNWQHRNTVEAMAVGLAQAGIVDGYIWETMKIQHHPLISKTRVAHKSISFTFPPLVATNNVSSHLKNTSQQYLLSMDKDAQGRRLLEQLNIDDFIPGDNNLYDYTLKMHLFIENRKHVAS